MMYQGFSKPFLVALVAVFTTSKMAVTNPVPVPNQRNEMLNLTTSEKATYYTLSADDYNKYISQNSIISSQAALLSEKDEQLSEKDERLSIQKDVLGYLTCARHVRNAIWIIQFKYMDYEFVRHFKDLKISIARTLCYPDYVQPQFWSDYELEEMVYNKLKSMSHFQRMIAFMHWIIRSDEYTRATSKIIAKPYRNGRLHVLADEIRKLYRGSTCKTRRPSIATIARIVVEVKNYASTIMKHSSVDGRINFEVFSNFLKSVVQFFKNDKAAEICFNVTCALFSGKNEITSAERDILIRNNVFNEI